MESLKRSERKYRSEIGGVMKYFLIGILIFLAMPIWVPLWLLAKWLHLTYEISKMVGEDVSQWCAEAVYLAKMDQKEKEKIKNEINNRR